MNLSIKQAEIFPETGGRVFYNEAVMSMNAVPTVSLRCMYIVKRNVCFCRT